MNAMRRGLAAALVAVLAATAAMAAGSTTDERLPLGQLATIRKAELKNLCEFDRILRANAPGTVSAGVSNANQIFMRETTGQACDCAPQAIDAYVAATGPDTLVVPAVALRIATRACAARTLRATIDATCAAGLDPFVARDSPPASADRLRARCTCMQGALARMTDEQAADALAARIADIAPRTASASAAASAPDAMRELEQACRD